MSSRAPRAPRARVEGTRRGGGGGSSERPGRNTGRAQELPLPPGASGATQRIPGSLWDALRRAMARVEAEPTAIEQGTQADDLRFQLEALYGALRQAAAAEEPTLERAAPAVPVQRVLHRLRACAVEELAAVHENVETDELLAFFDAFERVQSALDRDEAHRFASRLTGAGGLELLVEVGHDLRSPLASILFLAETLRKGQSGSVNNVQERQLGLIYSAAFGLSAMASDVIELARGGDRLASAEPVPFSVADVIQSVRDIVQPMAEEKGLAVVLQMPDADFRVGHPGALNRVLLNLTTNALKFTSEGQVEISALQRSRSVLEFSVKDTGRGIPPEVMSCLFETFRRRRAAGDYSFSSAGLGLSICRKLVMAMGGDLSVDTSPTTGTRFHFELDLPVAPRM